MLNVIMLSVFQLVVLLIMLNVPKLSVIESVIMLSIIIMSVMRKDPPYSKWRYGVYHFTECIMLNAIMASVSLC
jgi:hypothetical protein